MSDQEFKPGDKLLHLKTGKLVLFDRYNFVDKSFIAVVGSESHDHSRYYKKLSPAEYAIQVLQLEAEGITCSEQ